MELDTTEPLTLADALEAMARAELDEDTTVPAITRAMEALTPPSPHRSGTCGGGN